MKVIEGGVTAPKGFQAAGIFAGIKKDKKDMAMVYSEVPCVVAGTFTTNVVKAAPVKWDQHVVYEVGKASAIVANSGIANACTGEEGYGYCRETAAKTASFCMYQRIRFSWLPPASSDASFRWTRSRAAWKK